MHPIEYLVALTSTVAIFMLSAPILNGIVEFFSWLWCEINSKQINKDYEELVEKIKLDENK